jgi:outer membrane lipoprotein carrier protein
MRPGRLCRRLRPLVVLLAGAIAVPVAAADDAAAIRRVEGYLGQLSTVRAQFRQDLVDADGKLVEHSQGTMSLARPGRFRWDYEKPASLIVSDGRTLWLYDPELEQVTVRRLGEALNQTPAMLLAGSAAVHEGYVVRDGGEREGLLWVVLTPRQAVSDFSELKLGFAGSELRRMDFRSKLNQVTRITLERVEKNLKLDPSLFSFTPPPGVDVVGAPVSAP